ncbi:tetratricopeptide-like protein [Colletotrichum incanum]|uniref:Tetratricopeptide-like protein n=1 Tax=Colletotrichum incanum TaxID=1573173 RepID=A0A167C6C7_COLIC|nr:tetratricopeptide-like protein [Colletotrichum incanum]
MPSTHEVQESTVARERGNSFYRQGLFAEAEGAYKEAASLDPEDPTPWSNISAIKFEQGDYGAALKNLEIFCHLHSLSLDDAEKVVKVLSEDASGQSMRATLEDLRNLLQTSDDGELQKQVFDRLPRYKGHLQDRPEYYAMGHDMADPLWDQSLWHAVGPGGDVSFLLCGSGDARHLFATIVSLGVGEMIGRGKKMFNKAFFTILDINAAALARTLFMFDMVIRYIFMRYAKMPRIEDALTVMSYIYSSPFVPAFVAEKTEEHIKTLIDELEGEGDVLEMFFIPRGTRDQIIRKLKHWIQPFGDDYTTKKLRPVVIGNLLRSEQQRQSLFGESARPEVKDSKEIRELGVLFAGDIFIDRREPALRPLLDAFRSDVEGAKQTLEVYIDSHWKTNPTMLDMDYEPRRYEEFEAGVPLAELNRLLSGIPRNSLSGFFEILATATMTLIKRVEIEAIAGEMADTLEQIRYNSLEHRSQKHHKVGAIDATQFPWQYDRIHMSNIPDYVGGPLTAVMYGSPLLRKDRPSNLRFNNLFNPPMFESHEQFLTEYLLMHDAKQVADHFGLVKEKRPGDVIPNPIAETIGNRFMTENYFVWARSGIKKTPRARLMTRPTLERWLHSHLLKICLPYRRPLWSDKPVHAPLNLTAFLRLVARMYEVGYPAHWLAGIFTNICEGSITSTARPPWRLVLHPDDLKKSFPQRQISLGPWKVEFTTLLSLWRRLLPFGVVTPPRTLVNPVEVLGCNITFPKFFERHTRVPHFNLVFINTAMFGPEKPNLLGLLQDDEEGDASDYAKLLRQKGLHVVTTFKYVTDTRTATCWLRKDVVEEMMNRASWNYHDLFER